MSDLLGRILSRSGTRVVVEIDGEPLPTMELARHLHGDTSAAAGDACLVATVHGARYVVAVLGTAPAPPPPPPPPPDSAEDETVVQPKAPPVVTGSTPVTPVWTGTYRAGWRSDTADLYQGDWTGRGVNVGAAYYGSGFTTWGELRAVRVHLRRKPGAGVNASQAPTMALLAGGRRPSGAPSVLATAPGPGLRPGGSASFTVPAVWLPRLASGEAGGIGCTTGGSRAPYIALEASGAGMTATADWTE